MRRLTLWLFIACATFGLVVGPGIAEDSTKRRIDAAVPAGRTVASPTRWIALVDEDEAAKQQRAGTLSQSVMRGLGRQGITTEPRSTLRLTGSVVTDRTTRPSVTSSDLGRGLQGFRFRLLCVDAVLGILPNSDLELLTDILPGSGAHDHDNAGDPFRPLATLDPITGNTGPDGMQFRSEFTSPEESGVSIVGAICTPPDGQQVGLQFTVAVRIEGLQRLPDLDGLELRGATTAHPLANNHFGTTRLNSALAVLAVKYKAAFPNAPDLRINDQSLEEGGLFDIGPVVARSSDKPPYEYWKPPHLSHRFGVDVDMAFVPLRNRDTFAKLARQVGFIKILREGNHNHLRVAGGPS